MITLSIPVYLASCAICAALGICWHNYIVSRRRDMEREAERAELEDLSNVIQFPDPYRELRERFSPKVTDREPAA